jgi:hypothetical protein
MRQYNIGWKDYYFSCIRTVKGWDMDSVTCRGLPWDISFVCTVDGLSVLGNAIYWIILYRLEVYQVIFVISYGAIFSTVYLY